MVTLNGSCKKEDPCENVICKNGAGQIETKTGCVCDCLQGYIGTNCENYDPAQVQVLLDAGITPKTLYDGGILLDSLYGKMYEGGLIFYLNTADGTGMVAATSDQSTSAEWGCWNTEIDGANGEAIGNGAQNSMEILNGCMDIGIAAKLCDDLKLNGKDDWFLPSKDELNLMWTKLADADQNCENTGLDDPKNLGSFANACYWSSTEFSGNHAWAQFFFNGHQGYGSKLFSEHVRAVRAF